MQNASFRRGLILPAVASVIFLVQPSSLQAKSERQPNKANQTDNQQRYPSLPTFGVIGLPIVLSEWPSVAEGEKKETDWRNPNCANPTNHDEADLCEQRNSVSLNRAQIMLGVLGFAALMFTLGATVVTTRASVRAASAADKAVVAANDAIGKAEEANKISRETAKQELRAYVFAARAVLSKGENFFKATVTIQNFGQTPAYKFDHFAIIEGTDNPRTAPFIEGEIDVERTACIPPGSHVGIVCESNPIPAELMGTIESGRAILWVWGEVYYEDAFGQRQSTTYRFMYNGATAGTQGDGVMMADRDGNEAT